MNKSTNKEKVYRDVEDSFYSCEEHGITMERCSNGMKDECTVITVKLNDNYEKLLKKTQQIQKDNIVSQNDMLQLINIDFRGDQEPEEMWMKCSLTSNTTVNSIFSNQSIKDEEAAYLLKDILSILKICDDFTAKGIDFSINEECLMAKKDEKSPFLRIVLSPLIFFYRDIITANIGQEDTTGIITEYHEFIAEAIEKFCHVPGTDELVQAIRAKKPYEELVQLQTIQHCLEFTRKQTCDITEYQIGKRLGKGGYGVVYKASKGEMNYAIKESDKQHTDELIREALVMRICDHPNIVKFYGFSSDDSSATEKECGKLIMEYCDGGNLEELIESYIDRGIRMSLDMIESIFAQILKSQFYLHFEKNVVHRDIKLANYLIVNHKPYPIVKLSDFGLSRAIDGKVISTKRGTPLYCSQEVFYNGKITDKRDLYSIGICLYRLITLKYPFGTNIRDFYSAMMERKPVQFPPEYVVHGSEYEELIRLCLAMSKHDPEERISWEQLRNDPYVESILSKY